MTWTLDDVRLFVDEESDAYVQAVARLQPLASGTIYHVFGWESDIKRLSAKIVGNPDRIKLIDMTRDGEVHVLSGVGWWWGDYYVHSVQSRLEPTIWQTFYPEKDCDDYVFTVEIELYKDE